MHFSVGNVAFSKGTLRVQVDKVAGMRSQAPARRATAVELRSLWRPQVEISNCILQTASTHPDADAEVLSGTFGRPGTFGLSTSVQKKVPQ